MAVHISPDFLSGVVFGIAMLLLAIYGLRQNDRAQRLWRNMPPPISTMNIYPLQQIFVVPDPRAQASTPSSSGTQAAAGIVPSRRLLLGKSYFCNVYLKRLTFLGPASASTARVVDVSGQV